MSNLAIQLSNYSFENYQIRTTIKDGEVWFIAKDVCDAVKISNVTDALIKLDEDEKLTIGLTESHNGMGAQRLSIVSESGLYTLILRCRDAVKKGTTPYRFRKWVTSEVLPSIRKTGSYSLTINTEQQQAIKQAVNERHYRTGEHYQAIYSKLYEYFKIPRYQDLPALKFEEAINFLGGKIKHVTMIDDRQLYYVYFLLNHFNKLNEIFNRYNLYTHLKGLGSRAGVEMVGHFNDGGMANHYLKDLKPAFDAVQKRLGLNQHKHLNQF